MILELLIAILTVTLVMYLHLSWLDWSASYRQEAIYDNSKKNSIVYQLLAPRVVVDSKKYLQFWYLYYTTANTILN